jgi:PAS domain S-box-containing protein
MKTSFEGKKLYAVIIAFLLIITFFITFYIIRNHYQYVVKDTIAENKLKARFLSTLMYEHQKAAISILESYAQRPSFIDVVKKKDFHRAFYHLKSLSEHHTEIDALFITDKSGTLWANYPMDSKGFGKNLANRDWYKGVSKKWRPYISTVFRSIVLKKNLAVAVSVPVFDRKGKVIGILSGAQRIAFLDTFIKDNIIGPEKNVTLLDQEGSIIFSNAVLYQEKITKYPDAHVLEKALAGVFIDMEIADAKEKGSISYVSIASVRGIGWSVIVGQEKNAILKSLYRYFILSAVAGLVIFLFLTVSLLYFRREYRYRKTKELRESEERLRTIVEASLDAIMAVNAEGRLVLFNGAAQELFQYSEEEALNQPVDILLREEIGKIHQERLEKFLKRGVGQCGHIGRRMEKFFRRKDGSLFVAEVSMSGGRLDGLRLVVLAIHDITERKRTEEELRESEEKNRALFEDVPIESLVVTLEGRIVQYNKAFERSTEKNGRRLPEIGSRMYVDYASNHSIDMRTELIDCINSKTPKTFNEMPYKGRFLNISMAPTREGAIISAIDVTERKQTEEKLRVSEENFRRFMDESPLGICIMSEENILYANRAILDFFGYESIEELREIPFTKRYMESIYAEFLDWREKRPLRADDSSEYEIDIVRKDGEVRNLEVWRKRVLWNGNEHYQVIYRDITERKLSEERIHASLREKEILLMEVHHRVKNNMQVISGLLDLQASSSGNPELIERLNESQSRIRSMALIHEKLYGSKDFARIDLAGYVRTLSQDLFQSYKINPGKIDLIVQPDGDVYVDINKAIPCGLILNELISNVFKHAFPRDRHGELQIIIRETENTEIEILLRDNGVGLPDDVDIHQPRTVGLHLVNGLVKNQLDGQMEVRRDNGTEFRIKFPL